jgi:prepilin-type N-terminal cleavage/methylation domain-containing protein
MHSKTQNLKASRVREAGFSLLEMMIAMIIFLIFMGAVYGLLRIGNIQKSSVNTQTEIIKNIRLSLNTIGRDAVNAGLGYSRVGGFVPDNLTALRMNLPLDADTGQDLITAVISGNEINDNLALDAGKTDAVSFAFRDLNFNNPDPVNKANGDPLKLTAAADLSGSGVSITTAVNVTDISRRYDLYLISDGTRTALGMVTAVSGGGTTLEFQTGDPLGINELFAGASADTTSKLVGMNYPAVTAIKVNWISYRVSEDGVLMRTIYGNNNSGTAPTAAEQIQMQPVAYDIQNMQIKYLLTDGTLTDDPSNAGNNQGRLNDVVQITVTISARYSTTENGVTINRVVDLNSTFSTKNLSYDIG